MPAPSGLESNAWSYFALFSAVIVALILEPIPASAIGLIGITVLLLTAWIYFKELEPGTPLLNNVVVFALVNLNIILLMVLALLVPRNLVRLYQSSQSGLGGLRLQVKLIAAFVGFTLGPSVVLFLIASGLIGEPTAPVIGRGGATKRNA